VTRNANIAGGPGGGKAFFPCVMEGVVGVSLVYSNETVRVQGLISLGGPVQGFKHEGLSVGGEGECRHRVGLAGLHSMTSPRHIVSCWSIHQEKNIIRSQCGDNALRCCEAKA
jgi:hypothetical protein